MPTAAPLTKTFSELRANASWWSYTLLSQVT